MKYPFVKWKSLTPEQLEVLARDLGDHIGDELADRASIAEENGFDLIGVKKALQRFLLREVRRRTPYELNIAKLKAELAQAEQHQRDAGDRRDWEGTNEADCKVEKLKAKLALATTLQAKERKKL